MIQNSYTLEFIMPCFCAGANQADAEIRAPSIRGQLRWWFRALGATRQEEFIVFGGVNGENDSAAASAITIRVNAIKRGPQWKLPKLDISSNGYVYYYAKVSGATGGGANGPRWRAEGVISPGSTYCLTVLRRRSLPNDVQKKFDQALDCFLQLGAIGLRATRGLGTFFCREMPYNTAILDIIRKSDFRVEILPLELANEADIAREVGALLKGARKTTGYRFDRPSPFGSSSPRQTSAVYFRPVQCGNGPKRYRLVAFEAPHHRVLGRESRKDPVVDHQPSRFTKTLPDHRHRRGGGRR